MNIAIISYLSRHLENSAARKSLTVAGCCLLGLALVAQSGCGPSLPKTVPVSGTIKLNGKPIEGASVSFIRDSGGRIGYGISDAQGQFKISTFGTEDGATLGRHKVVVAKVDLQGLSVPKVEVEQNAEIGEPLLEQKGAWKPKSLLPEKYSNPETTDLFVEVSVGMDPVELNMTGELPK